MQFPKNTEELLNIQNDFLWIKDNFSVMIFADDKETNIILKDNENITASIWVKREEKSGFIILKEKSFVKDFNDLPEDILNNMINYTYNNLSGIENIYF